MSCISQPKFILQTKYVYAFMSNAQKHYVLDRIFVSNRYRLYIVKPSVSLLQIWWQLNCHLSLYNLSIVLKAMVHSILLIWIITITISGRNVKHLSLKQFSYLSCFSRKVSLSTATSVCCKLTHIFTTYMLPVEDHSHYLI